MEASSQYLKEQQKSIVITLATAHPSKFSASVRQILNFDPELPSNYKNIYDLEEKFQVIDHSYNSVKNYILKKVTK